MKRIWWIGCVIILIGAAAAHAWEYVWLPCGNFRVAGPTGALPPCDCPPCAGTDGADNGGNNSAGGDNAGGQEGINKFDVFTGNAHRPIRDLQVWGGVGQHQLTWTRYANTRFTGGTMQLLGNGGNWRHSYQWEMADNGITNTTSSSITIHYPDGSIYAFSPPSPYPQSSTNIMWTSLPAVPERLFQYTNVNLYVLQRQNGWRYAFTNDVSNGTYQLQYFTDSQGNRYDFAYTNGMPWRVYEPGGRYLQITYTTLTLNTNMTDITTVCNVKYFEGAGNVYSVGVHNSTPFRYYRYVGPDGSHSCVAEIQLFRDSGNTPMTGQPFGVGTNYVDAFDGKADTYYWYSGPSSGYTGLDLGAGNAQPLDHITLYSAPGMNLQMDGGRIEGFNVAPQSLLVIAKVETLDGRSVTYNYTKQDDTDPTVPVSYEVLSSATYSDQTSAQYTYQQVIPLARPLMVQATDPRYSGSGVNIEYVFNTDTGVALGAIQQERSSGYTIATLSSSIDQDGVANDTTVTLANGATHHYVSAANDYTPNEELQSYTDGLQRQTSYVYANLQAGFLASRTDPDGFRTDWTKSDYDNPLSIATPLPGGYQRREVWTRDDLDLVAKHTVYPAYDSTHGTSAGGQVTKYDRDPRHRVTTITYPDGSFETFTYDDTKLGLMTEHKLRNGATVSFEYDVNNRYLKTSSADAAGTTHYQYDSADRLQLVTDPLGHTTEYTYNDRGQVTQVIYADGSSKAFGYDSNGNLAAEVNSMGQSWIYTNDVFRRRISVTDPLKRVTQYNYSGGPAGCVACGAADKPSSIVLPSGKTISFVYDAEWQKTSESFGGVTTSFGYDAAGHLTNVTDPNSETWNYIYDNCRRLVGSKDPLMRTTQWVYDGYGNKTSETRPDGSMTSYEYDQMNRMVRITAPGNNITKMTYDSMGNVLTVTDAKNQTYSYHYDSLNRLDIETYPDSSTEHYSYDAVGNMTQYTSRSGGTTAYSYDQRNREIQSVTSK